MDTINIITEMDTPLLACLFQPIYQPISLVIRISQFGYFQSDKFPHFCEVCLFSWSGL